MLTLNVMHWFRPKVDPLRLLELNLRVFRKRQEALMSSLAEVLQKSNDVNAAIGVLASSIDTLKTSHAASVTTLSSENQLLVDSAATALDQALAAISATQVKVNNP